MDAQSNLKISAGGQSGRPVQGRGLKRIPDYVLAAIPASMRRELEQNGHGISFPERSGCQMRIIRDGLDRGGFYSYRQYGSIPKAIEAAMNRNRMVRLKFNADHSYVSEWGFVYLSKKLDKRRNKTEWKYQVSYRKNGKPACKAFSMGYGEPSTEKQMHAYLTAKLFRFYFDELGPDFDESVFKDWKTTRLYLKGSVAFNWDDA